MKKSPAITIPSSDKAAVFSVSAVIPVYNSQGSLAVLVKRLVDILSKVTKAFEIILVEDGSSDQSWGVIQKLSEDFPQVRGLRLMRNYGQHNALLCGIRAAKYETIVTMDDDLQQYPEEIPALLNKLSEGHDVVYGTPRKLPHSLWRNLLSKYIKWAMARAMGIRNVRDINAFRAFRTEIRKAFAEYRSPDLMLDVLLAWGTTRFATVEIDYEPRRIGKSNYTLFKLFNQVMLMFTGFSTGPLRLASFIGFTFTIFGFGVFIYVVGRYFIQGTSVPGFPFLGSIIAIFSGAQLFSLGIIGEYLARMFDRSTERPVYVVSETTEEETRTSKK